MQRRVLGLPVIVEHPPGSMLTSRYYGDAAVGTIIYSFVKDDELFGVARILDAMAGTLIAAGAMDTSPGVVFAPVKDGAGVFVELDDGSPMLVEGVPCLLDHLALVFTGEGNKGIWSRSEDSPGVEVTQTEGIEA